ncbi:FecR/PupR family sigma factor regulator, partial [Pseudomonas aeruginosa]|uniref:FecR/PupR family sigma factor regulator n=1 Tax=Pseudomonas aeruginosa TaxID=287 RepID=UPI0030149AE8
MNSPQEQQQIRQQAAEWAIRLDGGDLDRSRREALDGWLAADPGGRFPRCLGRSLLGCNLLFAGALGVV